MAEQSKKAFLDGTGLDLVWKKIRAKFVSLDSNSKVPSDKLPIATDTKLGAVKKGDNIEIDTITGAISSPDVSVKNNGSDTGYVSSITADGHGITVTKTALPSIPEIPDISIINSNSGDFISDIEATDHTITVTKGTLPEIPDVSVTNDGASTGYVSGITTNGHGITVTKTALPGINVNGNDTEGDFISSILADGHTITVTKGTLPEIPNVSIVNNGESTGYVSNIAAEGHNITVTKTALPTIPEIPDISVSTSGVGVVTDITADEHNINVTKTALPKVQVKTTGSGNGVVSISATDHHEITAVMGNFVSLDESGKISSSQLPSYVDDVIEAASFEALPPTGESGKIYVTTDTNKTYRWATSQYVEISESLALGNTQNTAFRGDYGQDAYNHATNAGATNITTGVDTGLYKVKVNSMGHVTDVDAVTKSDITDLGIQTSIEVQGEMLVIS